MAELGVPKSTYYRWRARLSQRGIEDRSSGISVGNRLTPEEESVVLEVAMEQTHLSSRQLATWITDNLGLLSVRVHGVPYPPTRGLGKEP